MRLIALIAAAWFAVASPVLAQSALPDSLRAAGVTQAQWDALQREARAQARRANISEAALLAAAEAASVRLAGSGRFNPLSLQQTIMETLADQADRIAELQRRLDALTGDADPAVATLFEHARVALNEGRLEGADRLLAQVAQSDLAAIQQADAEVERRRLRAGETIASRGQVAFVQADYLGAAAHYERAADVVPQSAIRARWQYTVWRGSSLFERSRLFGEPEPLERSLSAYVSALSLRSREAAPQDWGLTQNDLGNALELQGERGVEGALARAVAAYEAALAVRTRDADPIGWAQTQMNLGVALRILGERGDPGAFVRAVAAYESALTVRTRQSDPRGWALTQVNLGNVLVSQGQRGAPGALERAAAAYEAALTVTTRESDPARWAGTQMNLGNVLVLQGERGAPGAFDRAVAVYEAALTVRTREADPIGWATTQMNLGNALVRQGERGRPGAFARAVMAYEAALTVLTRNSDPAGWAMAQANLGAAYSRQGPRDGPQALERAVAAYNAALTVMTRAADASGWAATTYNLAVAYRALGRYGEARSAARGALDAYEQLGNAQAAQIVRSFIARLPE